MFVCMAQGGKTASMLNVAGHRLDDSPAPILYICPTRNVAVKAIHPKVDEMLRTTPGLWQKTAQGKSYTTTSKVISGCTLRTAWAGSSNELATDTAAVVLVDELDRMLKNVRGQGNVLEQADARHASYADGRTAVFSTPTVGNVETFTHPKTGLEHWEVAPPEAVESAVWLLWQEGTRHEFAVPCPHCRDWFIPRLSLLQVRDDASPSEARREAAVLCPGCGVLIGSDWRMWMKDRGVYVSPGQRPLPYDDADQSAHVADWTSGDAPELVRGGRGVHEVEFGCYALPAGEAVEDASFWVSGLMNFSAKRTFGDIASRLARARASGEPEKLQGVINLVGGECFRFGGGEAPSWHAVAARRADYRSGQLVKGVNMLTAGVDVQMNRLVYVVRGWGAGWESWLVEAGELWGATDKLAVWRDLSMLIQRSWTRKAPDGSDLALRPERVLIDSGYRAEEVYGFVRSHQPIAFAAKGSKNLVRPYYANPIDVTINGRTYPNGVELWHFNDGIPKAWIHSRMDTDPEDPAQWHIPIDTSDDYCKQIVSEVRIALPGGGWDWKVTGDNHFLDAEKLARIAAQISGNPHVERFVGANPTAAGRRRGPIVRRRG